MITRTRLVLFASLTAACYPATTRPAFLPAPAAPSFEVELGVPEATRLVALALDGDSLPVRRTETRDGWLETDWYDLTTRRATTQRPIGPDIVKIRAFVDPSRPNHVQITVEVVYRPLADPSRTERELEQQVPSTHPLLARVVGLMTKLAQEHGGAAADTVGVKKP